jgi:hypothetical protein
MYLLENSVCGIMYSSVTQASGILVRDKAVYTRRHLVRKASRESCLSREIATAKIGPSQGTKIKIGAWHTHTITSCISPRN